MAGLHVEIREPDADLAPHWRDLVGRAPANVFLDPAGLGAVRESGLARPLVALAWDTTVTPARLVGLMALTAERVAGLFARHLAALPHDYAFLSSPVIDPAFADRVIPAFFAEIARRPDLPRVIRLKYLDAGDDAHRAIAAALAAGPAHNVVVLGERERPFATREAGIKRSGSTRKKLRQDWNRLAATGAVDIVNDRDPAAAGVALEVFLAMEAASWKGGHGTAFLSRAGDADFARRFFAALAAAGNASVALLTVDGKPIAAQVLIHAGTTAYTWKIAYDAAYARFSPGALLVDKVSETLLDGGAVTAIESCSPEGGFMTQIWSGRRPTVDLLVDLGPGRSLTFVALIGFIQARAEMKALRNRLRAGDWPRKRAKPAPVRAPAET